MSIYKGKFIVLDGGDGCGKSTQADLLTEWIRARGVNVETFRDPGTTVIGEKIRDILLDPCHEGMGDNVEVLLYMAARAQLWKEKLGPALAAGSCVIMDRWISSTCAYQGHAGGFGIQKVINLGNDCLERVWPDLTILLDADLKTSTARLDRELDRMEKKGDNYHQKVREGYLELSRIQKGIEIVDAAGTIEQVRQRILEVVNSRFQH